VFQICLETKTVTQQNKDLIRLQHKFEGWQRRQAERLLAMGEKRIQRSNQTTRRYSREIATDTQKTFIFAIPR
jgi:hypothetical protein